MDPVTLWITLGCFAIVAATLVAWLSRLRRKRHLHEREPGWIDDDRDLW